ncbi:MAG: DUF5010 C-terminal domain-containing protein [Fibrobacterales bacterium]
MKYTTIVTKVGLWLGIVTWIIGCSAGIEPIDASDFGGDASSAIQNIPITESSLRELRESILSLEAEHQSNSSISAEERLILEQTIEEQKIQLQETAQLFVDKEVKNVAVMELELIRIVESGATQELIDAADLEVKKAKSRVLGANRVVSESTEGIIEFTYSSYDQALNTGGSSSSSIGAVGAVVSSNSRESSNLAVGMSSSVPMPPISSSSLSTSTLSISTSVGSSTSSISSSAVVIVSSSVTEGVSSTVVILSSESISSSSAIVISSSEPISSSSVVVVSSSEPVSSSSAVVVSSSESVSSSSAVVVSSSESVSPSSAVVVSSSESVSPSSAVVVSSSEAVSSSEMSVTYTLVINTARGGTLIGASTRVVETGKAENISVSLESGFTFKKWKKVSGAGVVVFGKFDAKSTTVSITGGNVVITPVYIGDISPPTKPLTLKTSQGTTANTSFRLSWTASTDNQKVVGYKIYKNGSVFAKTAQTYFDIKTSLFKSGRIQVTAYDAVGNESVPSKGLYHFELEHATRNERITFKGTGYKYAGGLSNSNEKLFFDTVTLKAGNYKMKIRYADALSNTINEFQFLWNKQSPTFVDKIFTQKTTGGWEKWTLLSTGTFSLKAGTGTVKFQFVGKDFNTDWVQFIEQ